MDLSSEVLRSFKRTFEFVGRCKIKSCIGVRNVTLKSLNGMKIDVDMHLFIST